jgi:hypothetical protein
MDAELVQALNKLRESVDALRGAIVEITGPNASGPGQTYLDELREMHAKGLIDEKTWAAKEKAFLAKF